MEGVIVFLMICVTIYAIYYLIITTRHKERMAIMDKDIDPNLVWGYKTPKKSNRNLMSIYLLVFLKIGMILIAISIGILLGNYLYYVVHLRDDISFGSAITLCIGLSLIVFYFIGKKSQKKMEE